MGRLAAPPNMPCVPGQSLPNPAPLPGPVPPGDGFDHLDLGWLAGRPGVKWSSTPAGTIAAWVADMDFPAPAPVRRSLAKLADEGDLGYSAAAQLLEEPWAKRMVSRFGWEPKAGLLRPFSDVVQAVQVLLHAGTRPGDGIIVLTPSYPPFVSSVRGMGRRLLSLPFTFGPQGWELDLEAARALAPAARAILLVNPHNPTGRVLRRAELELLADLAERYDLLVVSDEIHADLVLADIDHIPFASLSEEAARRTVTLYSASKSFNLGGMRCAVAHMGHGATRAQMATLPSHLFGEVGLAAVTAALAAWSDETDPWLRRCVARLRDNATELGSWLRSSEVGGRVLGARPEATYLAWLDFRPALGLDDPAGWLSRHAHVRLSAGPEFGPGGAGFARLNFATAPNVLAELLGRLSAALAGAGAVQPAPVAG